MARTDGWANLVTGVAANHGRSNMRFFRDGRLSFLELEDIYHGDAYAARVCDTVPEEACRKGINFHTDNPALNASLGTHAQELHAIERFEEAWVWARATGGALVWLGIDDGQPPFMPLAEDKIKSINFAITLMAREVIVDAWYKDPLKPTFGNPERYRLARQGGGGGYDGSVVHASRMIRFDGARTSRLRKNLWQGWSESELQRIYTQLTQFNGAYASVSTLLQEASQGIYKLKNLISMMASDNYDNVRMRLSIMDRIRSVARAIVVDAEGEDFTRTEVNFANIPQVIDKYLLFLAGVAKIPVTVLMGQSPAGLNATGESDIRWFYDRTASAQQSILRPRYERFGKLMCLAKKGPTNGELPKILEARFPTLYTLTPKEDAEGRKMQADADHIYVTDGVVTPEEIATSRFPKDGWSAETHIDLEVRDVAKAANDNGESDETETPPPGDVQAAAFNGAQIAALQSIIVAVATRQIPRESGVQMILLSFPTVSKERAELVMGDTGTGTFTTPAPDLEAKHADLQAQHAKLQRSHTATKAIMGRVLEANKNGQLVTGSPVGMKAQAVVNGEAAPEDVGDAAE